MESADYESGSTPGSRRLTRVTSGSNIVSNARINVSKINALRVSVDRNSDVISKLLLSSKETVEKRSLIESAFRACREAFIEVSTVLAHILEERPVDHPTLDDIRGVVTEVLEDGLGAACRGRAGLDPCGARGVSDSQPSYASVAGRSTIRVSGGPTVSVPPSTSFLIVPKEGVKKYESSQATKEALSKVFKPSDCALKINRVSFANKNGVKIDALSPNIDAIKTHPGLARAGLEVVESTKMNPRLIIHNVPIDMTSDEILDEIAAQNLENFDKADLKVIYLFPAKADKRTTSCVLEVSPMIRNMLLNRGRIYLRYSACRFADYVRVLQCYNCLAFGHLAKNCGLKTTCGYCGGEHQMRDCDRRVTLKCGNCLRSKQFSTGDLGHAATDAKKCPILSRKISSRISSINYG
ncbi:uncharacterized protein LOC109861773 [Pseudomyrmex gracilis]|uniref:uncharacterized protein LOC109861773 n=1 Tax=Pseudomyrmex gracilis TaxID=219809 RepID=UPI000995D713|nr:uncharacterized protein LOC109861773 [Pseudomyrmex gracilis]